MINTHSKNFKIDKIENNSTILSSAYQVKYAGVYAKHHFQNNENNEGNDDKY